MTFFLFHPHQNQAQLMEQHGWDSIFMIVVVFSKNKTCVDICNSAVYLTLSNALLLTLVAADKVFGMSRLCRVSDKCLSQIRKRFFTIIELTKCFQEFSKCESTNFFINISQLKQKTTFLLVKTKEATVGWRYHKRLSRRSPSFELC